MQNDIINALAAKLKAFANLNNYLNNSAGIGEHPDIVLECEKLLSELAEAEDKLKTLQQLLPKNVEESE